jgi:DNA-binding transcriptional ArsR family regulator
MMDEINSVAVSLWHWLKKNDLPNWIAVVFTAVIWPIALIVWNGRRVHNVELLELHSRQGARLAKSEATVMELAQPFAMTQPAISRHLKVLEHAGLIIRRSEGTKRPCRLAGGGIDGIDEWLAMLRKALTQNYHRLDQLLAEMQPAKRKDKS